MTVAEVGERMSYRESRTWLAFELHHQPLPDRMFDMHLARIASLIVNLARSADGAPVEPADFSVRRDPHEEVADQSIDEQMRNWRGG